jgi:F-type H+-transporting ATPase subunit delta
MQVTTDDSRTGGLAMRYATAVFELAAEERAVDSLAADLGSLKGFLLVSPELARLVRSPLFSREDQAKCMEAVLVKAGAGPLTRKLVLLLAQKRRLFALADVIRAFEQLLARQRGEVAAQVTSARPLSPDEADELKRALKAKLGREPRLDLRVDPSLLGGLRLKLGSRMIDSSLRTKLEGLRAAMKGAS